MSSPNELGDPRTGRDRRVPARARTFKHGTVDPVTNHRRPLFTFGNLVLLVIMVGFGMYATGNLPQLDTFFDNINSYGRAHNNIVVTSLITYGAYLFGALALAFFAWMVFLYINSSRRSHSDPKGWHKVADAPRHHHTHRRSAADLPSMIMPVGKGRPATTDTATPKPVAKAATRPTAAAAAPDFAKAEAMAAAAKAEATFADAPADLPSFVLPVGKAPKPKPVAHTRTAPAASAQAKMVLPTQPSMDAPPIATVAEMEAAIAAAKAAAAKAEAAVAAAKAEAAIAAARAEAAIAEATIAAAKATIIAG